MKFVKTLVFMAAAATLAVSGACAQPKEGGTHVGIAVSSTQDTLRPGSGAELLFRFNPGKGYHVNAVPPMTVTFDSASPAMEKGGIAIPTDSATGYLRSAQPVRRPFTIAPGAARGRAVLKGVLTYYYCSDAEGWCRKENMPFALPVLVK